LKGDLTVKYAVRYYTRSGNTERLAKAIAEAVGAQATSVDTDLEERVDVLLLACSYYAFDMDEAVKKFIADNHQKIGEIVCFGTSAMMKSMKKPMQKLLDGYDIGLCDEEFHCRGEFWKFHIGHPNSDDLKNAAELAVKIVNKK
jgi:flavodoxin